MNSLVKTTYCVNHVRLAASKALPRFVFDFIDGAAQTGSTHRENMAALQRWRLVPRGLMDVAMRSQQVSLFGAPSSMPVIIGPTGYAAGVWPHGDLELLRAATAEGIPFVVSHATTVSLEDIAVEGNGRKWFQLTVPTDREAILPLLDRVDQLGFEVLEVTMDTALPGRRLRDMENGVSVPFAWSVRKLLDVARHPAWAARMAPHGIPNPALMDTTGNWKTPSEFMSTQINPGLTWDDLKWLRARWKRPLVIKGICSVDQAQQALALGADGIVVSNHGGRQLDGAVATVDALPAIAEAVADKMTVIIDGGFMTGTDIFRALALGASAVQLGRATLYGLGIAGQAGVRHVLSLLRTELDLAQGLCGVSSLSAIPPNVIRHGAHGIG